MRGRNERRLSSPESRLSPDLEGSPIQPPSFIALKKHVLRTEHRPFIQRVHRLAGPYLIWEARRLGVPFGTLLRMVGNVGLDALISAVPVAGWVGDVFWRANLRNVALLREHLDQEGSRQRLS